ncbi:hypothetical protein BH10PSE7_BH10PSE7_31390 [soil metagenome]
MNAISNLALRIPMPKIEEFRVIEHLVIEVKWSAGLRGGRTDVVDLSPMINLFRLYRPIRENEALFRTIHRIEDGRVLAWGDDDQIDMAAESVEDLAEETMTADDLRTFLRVNKLTHSDASALLDRSRRQIENYLSGAERIPRLFVMACFGLLARREYLRGPITKPTQISRWKSETSSNGALVQTTSNNRHIGFNLPYSGSTLVPISSLS